MEIDNRRIVFKHYALAAFIIVLGVGALIGGDADGVYVIAAGAIIATLARAVHLGRSLGGYVPRGLLYVVLALAVIALIWAASEWQPRDGERPGRPAGLAAGPGS